jgi:FkbM family methyltransferase
LWVYVLPMGIVKRAIIYLIQQFFAIFNLRIIRKETLGNVRQQERNKAPHDLRFLTALPSQAHTELLKYLPKSQSQLRQDLLVLYLENFKRKGFFVEFGATNGIDLSNTYLLETEFGWDGILAEPAVCWQPDLKLNRMAAIENRCVWSSSGAHIEFNETAIPELSTVDSFSYSDLHSTGRKTGKRYIVETISINDLLKEYKAPRHIDYLSIDTEGSEFEILSSLDFEQYSFGVITCEHNFTIGREKIHALLNSHGYTRIFTEISGFDDWYVRSGDESKLQNC